MKMQQLVLEFTSRFDGRGVSELIDRMRSVRYETEGVMHTMNRLGAVFTAVTGAAASSFKRYEFSLTEFAGKAMKTTEEFGALFGKVSGNIARASGLARAEVLRGLQEGTSAQLNAQFSADLTRKAAILGAGRQSLMRQTVNVALSGYRNAFGDPGKILDYVYASAQLGQGQVPEFAPAAQYVFPFARGAGIGLSEVAAGLSAISTTAPSPLMGSTQFGAFLTGIARGSTFEQMLKDKTGGRSSQDIRDMLRDEGLARTAEFLASKFSGDELQQVYGRKELVQFVQGVTGQPGLLSRLERMITANAESKPIERFGKDLENTMQNQFDRLVQTMNQLGADFGKPVGELAKLLLRFTRGIMETLISINENLGGALSYLFTYGGGLALMERLPFVGALFKTITGGAARKWTEYATRHGIDQSGPIAQMLLNFGIETAAGGAVMGGYSYFDNKIKNAKDKPEKKFAKRAKRAYADFLEQGYDEATARRMAEEVYTGERESMKYSHAEGKSVGAAYVKRDEDEEGVEILRRDDLGYAKGVNYNTGSITVFSDGVGETKEEKRWLKNQEKREKANKLVRLKSQFPPWSLWQKWDTEKKRSFLGMVDGGPRMGWYLYNDMATGPWAEHFLKSENVTKTHPDFYSSILRVQNDGRRKFIEYEAERKFLEAFESGEVQFRSEDEAKRFKDWFDSRQKIYYPTEKYLRETADIWNKKGADEFEGFIMKYIRSYGEKGYSTDIGGHPLSKSNMKNYAKELSFVVNHPYMNDDVKKRATGLIDLIADVVEKDSWEDYSAATGGGLFEKHGLKGIDHGKENPVVESFRKAAEEIEEQREKFREASKSKFYNNDKTSDSSAQYIKNDDDAHATWNKYKKNINALLDDSERLGQAVDLKNDSEWGDVEKRIALLRELESNPYFKPGQRTKLGQTARVLEMFLESGEYSDPFKEEKARRAQEIAEEKAFNARVEAEYAEADRIRKETEAKKAAEKKKAAEEKVVEQKKAAAEKAAPPAPPPPPPPPPPKPPSGGSGSGGGGVPPRPGTAIFDPVTGQYLFDYGTGHRWGTLPQQMGLDLGPGGGLSRLTQGTFGSLLDRRQSRRAPYPLLARGAEPSSYDYHRFDPATGQFYFDYGMGHRSGTIPEQMGLDLQGGGWESMLTQLAFDTFGFGLGALGADYLGGYARKWYNAVNQKGPDVSAEKLQTDRWVKENIDEPRRRAESEEKERNQRMEAEKAARVRRENLEKIRRQSAELKRENEERETRRQEEKERWRARNRAQEKHPNWFSDDARARAAEGTRQWRHDKVFGNTVASQMIAGVGAPSFIDMITFGASGWIGDLIGEGVGKFSASRFGSSFIDGKARMGIKEFFGQAKSKDMPKDISKMAYFMGRMYGMATSPVGLGVGATMLGLWGVNKAIDSTPWGKDQIELSEQRDASIFHPDRIRDFQRQNLEWAEEFIEENTIPSGRGNMGKYSSTRDWWRNPFVSLWKDFWKREEDRAERVRVHRIYSQRHRLPQEERGRLMAMLDAAGWEENPRYGETINGILIGDPLRRKASKDRSWNITAIPVPESLAKEYGWLEAKEFFGENSEFMIEGDPNLDRLRELLAHPDLLVGANEQKINQWMNYNRTFPEKAGEFPVHVNVYDHSTINITDGADAQGQLIEILDQRNQERADEIVDRFIRNFSLRNE